MTYQRPDGTTFVLQNHDLEEWAEKRREQLLGLECSPAYIEQVVTAIKLAEPIATTGHVRR